LKEETYNFLNKKKLELDIEHSANHSLHEIVDYAVLPEKATSPNVPLIKGVAVFAALIIALCLIYLLNFFFRTVSSVYEIKDKLDYPLAGTVKRHRGKDMNREVLLNLYSNVLNMGAFEGSKMITLSSISDNEGKTFITRELGNLLAEYGKRVLLIDMNFQQKNAETPWLEEVYNTTQNKFLKTTFSITKNILNKIFTNIYWTRKLLWFLQTKSKSLQEIMVQNKQTNKNLDYVFLEGDNKKMTTTQLFSPSTSGFLNEMKKNYDVVLVDTDNITRKVDAAAAMSISDYNFFVFRKGISRTRKLNFCNQFIDAYNLKNIYLVFNGN